MSAKIVLSVYVDVEKDSEEVSAMVSEGDPYVDKWLALHKKKIREMRRRNQ